MRFNHQVLNRVLAGIAVFVVSSSAVADILHVPGDYPTIQEAIDAAVDGDEVEVHPGIYNETINFLGKAVCLHSSGGPRVTIIDAQQTGTVVTCNLGEGPNTVLSGFVITGGNAGQGGGMRNLQSSPTVTNCTFTWLAAGFAGWLSSNRLGRHTSKGRVNDEDSVNATNCDAARTVGDGSGGGDHHRVGTWRWDELLP